MGRILPATSGGVVILIRFYVTEKREFQQYLNIHPRHVRHRGVRAKKRERIERRPTSIKLLLLN